MSTSITLFESTMRFIRIILHPISNLFINRGVSSGVYTTTEGVWSLEKRVKLGLSGIFM